ncbi:hypothetical protein ACF07Q_12510 [Nocardiopsis dassonvillei]|uniref:TPR repeat region-containing protein n=1 Tax=Nocardiopsis dassonvillei TaxID=2014 RepID=UPI0037010BD0
MATFDLTFQPRSTTANPEAIRARIEELNLLQDRLMGRADDLTGQFNTTATQFTDILGWNIKGLSEEDYQYWREAGVAIAYAASQLEQWAQYVEEFKDEREAQNTEWFDFRTKKEDEIPADFQGQTITATHPERGGFLGMGDANKCRDIYDEVAAKLSELQERERTNYQNFEEHADEVAADLREGPTKANVQALIDAGINPWAFYSLDPNRYTMLVDGQELTEENAQEWADELSSYWSGDKPLDENYHELMLMMSMITTNAMQAQQGGTGYRSEEMDFLQEFYDRLEEESPDHMGVVGIPVQMEGDHLTDEEREHALGMLGDGLLALSDPDIGGGYGDLPPSVRNAIDIPFTDEEETPGDLTTQEGDARTYASLSALFAHTSDDMEGGYGLSTRLSLSAGAYIELWGDSTEHWVSSEEIGNLVDVAARNKDANYYLLTGDHLNPESGVDYTDDKPTDALVNLFTYEWPDDGADIRGLTDWLAEDGASEDTDIKERADKAMDGFIEIITRPDIQESLMRTGNQVDDTSTTEDEEGNEVTEEFEWRDVSMGHLNPEIADSLAGIFETYIDTFADSSIIEGNSLTTDMETDYNEDRLVISLDDRRTFAQFIAGNPGATERMLAATDNYTQDGIHQYFAGSGDEESMRNVPRETGLLWNAVGSGVSDEAAYRVESHTSGLDREKKNLDFVVDLTATGIRNPQLAETYKFFAKEFISTSIGENQQEIETRTFDDYSPVIRAQVEVGALDFYAGVHSENWGDEPWKEGPFKEDMYDGNQNFIDDQNGWQNEESSNDTDSMRDDAWRQVSDLPIPGREPERTFYTHTEEYMETLNEMMRISGQ